MEKVKTNPRRRKSDTTKKEDFDRSRLLEWRSKFQEVRKQRNDLATKLEAAEEKIQRLEKNDFSGSNKGLKAKLETAEEQIQNLTDLVSSPLQGCSNECCSEQGTSSSSTQTLDKSHQAHVEIEDEAMKKLEDELEVYQTIASNFSTEQKKVATHVKEEGRQDVMTQLTSCDAELKLEQSRRRVEVEAENEILKGRAQKLSSELENCRNELKMIHRDFEMAKEEIVTLKEENKEHNETSESKVQQHKMLRDIAERQRMISASAKDKIAKDLVTSQDELKATRRDFDALEAQIQEYKRQLESSEREREASTCRAKMLEMTLTVSMDEKEELNAELQNLKRDLEEACLQSSHLDMDNGILKAQQLIYDDEIQRLETELSQAKHNEEELRENGSKTQQKLVDNEQILSLITKKLRRRNHNIKMARRVIQKLKKQMCDKRTEGQKVCRDTSSLAVLSEKINNLTEDLKGKKNVICHLEADLEQSRIWEHQTGIRLEKCASELMAERKKRETSDHHLSYERELHKDEMQFLQDLLDHMKMKLSDASDDRNKFDNSTKKFEQRIAESDNELLKLQEEMAQSKAIIEEFRQQKLDYEAKILELSRDKSKSEAKIRNLSQQLSEYQEEFNNLFQEKSEYEAKIQEISEQKSQRETKIQEFTQQISGYEAKIQELFRKKSKSEARILDYSNQKSAKTSHEKHNRLNKELEDSTKHRNKLIQEKAQIQSLLDKSERRAKTFEQRATEAVAQVEKLKVDKTLAEAMIRDLTEHSKDISRLKSEYEFKMEKHSQEKCEYEFKIREFSEEKSRYETRIQEAFQQKSEYEARIQDYCKEKSELETKIQELSNQKLVYEDEIQELSQEKTHQHSKNAFEKSQYEARIQELSSQKTKYEARIQELTIQNSEYESKIRELSEEKSRYETRIQEAFQQKSEYEAKIQNYRKEKFELETKIQELSIQRIKYEDEIHELKECVKNSKEGDLLADVLQFAEQQSEYEVKIQALNRDKSEHEAKIQELSKQMSECEAKLQDYSNEKSEYESRILEFEQNMTEHEEKVKQLLVKKSEYEVQIKEYSDENLEYAAQIQEYSEEKSGYEARIQELLLKISVFEKQVEKLSHGKCDQPRRNQRRNPEKIQDCSQQKSVYESKISELSQQKFEYEEEIRELKEKIKKCGENGNIISSKLRKMEENAGKSEQLVAELRAKLVKARRKEMQWQEFEKNFGQVGPQLRTDETIAQSVSPNTLVNDLQKQISALTKTLEEKMELVKILEVEKGLAYTKINELSLQKTRFEEEIEKTVKLKAKAERNARGFATRNAKLRSKVAAFEVEKAKFNAKVNEVEAKFENSAHNARLVVELQSKLEEACRKESAWSEFQRNFGQLSVYMEQLGSHISVPPNRKRTFDSLNVNINQAIPKRPYIAEEGPSTSHGHIAEAIGSIFPRHTGVIVNDQRMQNPVEPMPNMNFPLMNRSWLMGHGFNVREPNIADPDFALQTFINAFVPRDHGLNYLKNPTTSSPDSTSHHEPAANNSSTSSENDEVDIIRVETDNGE